MSFLHNSFPPNTHKQFANLSFTCLSDAPILSSHISSSNDRLTEDGTNPENGNNPEEADSESDSTQFYDNLPDLDPPDSPLQSEHDINYSTSETLDQTETCIKTRIHHYFPVHHIIHNLQSYSSPGMISEKTMKFTMKNHCKRMTTKRMTTNDQENDDIDLRR